MAIHQVLKGFGRNSKGITITIKNSKISTGRFEQVPLEIKTFSRKNFLY